jgi:hypothetical protein
MFFCWAREYTPDAACLQKEFNLPQHPYRTAHIRTNTFGTFKVRMTWDMRPAASPPSRHLARHSVPDLPNPAKPQPTYYDDDKLNAPPTGQLRNHKDMTVARR